jgi:invasion protein IalB
MRPTLAAAAVLACLASEPASAQRALAVITSEVVDAWTVVCTRDLVTDEVGCSMMAPVEVFAGQGWQALDPAVMTIASETGDGPPRPVISLVSPDFSFAAAIRFDARRAVRIDGSCDETTCRVADAFAQPLAAEIARSTVAVIRGATGHDIRVQVSGYTAAWARLLAVSAERARPGDQAADLIAPVESAPRPLPAAPLTNVRLRRAPR